MLKKLWARLMTQLVTLEHRALMKVDQLEKEAEAHFRLTLSRQQVTLAMELKAIRLELSRRWQLIKARLLAKMHRR